MSKNIPKIKNCSILKVENFLENRMQKARNPKLEIVEALGFGIPKYLTFQKCQKIVLKVIAV